MNRSDSQNQAFQAFTTLSTPALSPLRTRITAHYRRPEAEAVQALLEVVSPSAAEPDQARSLARQLAHTLRHRDSNAGKAGLVQNLLQEYSLSSQEGVALMCLAEALLRIPDQATRDALIRDKIANGQWQQHLGKSPSLFVNAATWGLLLTGRLVATHSETGLSSAIGRLLAAGGEPLIRKSVDMAMRMLGEQFVSGQTIAEALVAGESRETHGFRHSYDMLGEAAMTANDASRYLRHYEDAIHAIGAAANGRGIYDGPGISIKLSALHPRYQRSQIDRVMNELYPLLVRLCSLAKRYDIGLNIDAEEADRLELSLDLLERLCHEPQLQSWHGLGFVVQAYQKRCPAVITYLIDLAQRSQRRLMVRLVKGAYWDTEIKRAQVDGLSSFPVYTRKPHTDLSYLACARLLLDAPDAVYPQFATHNARTVASIYHMAGADRYVAHQYEFQCLHGMGEPLYEQIVTASDPRLRRPCRIYAPVGTHETLLAYLVRRLLENGANTSFVNQMADPRIDLDTVIEDPLEHIRLNAIESGAVGASHPAIALPSDLYGPERRNSVGLDLSDESVLRDLSIRFRETSLSLAPNATLASLPDASAGQIDAALAIASDHAPVWAQSDVKVRARALEQAADQFQARLPELCALLILEAGKTTANAIGEVREAIDFLRYYAAQARTHLHAGAHRALGPVVCISPWNFPLAIFAGQVSAALAAGNVVLAKPAEQTPRIARLAVQILHDAGIPRPALQYLPGDGATVGARLVASPAVRGVLFTGSTDVARLLQKALIGRTDTEGHAVPLIAETGGQNAMIVDSSALLEQVTADILASAFDSAGQRCSALRVLCVQEDSADSLIRMLLGAMAELRVGRPDFLSTDIGPVIDAEAKAGIDHHVEHMRAKGFRIHQIAGHNEHPWQDGHYVLPTVIEIPDLTVLEREVFGPVLHVVRYAREQLAQLLEQINATGYALTLGLHTRIDETIDQVVGTARAGNIYVNRNMVGAVVGVQPFGGEGLSGTGPKAGGPLYLYRLLSHRPVNAWRTALPSRPADNTASDHPAPEYTVDLRGPTGERNQYRLEARRAVLCLANDDADRNRQMQAVLEVGARIIWPATATPHYLGLSPHQRDQVSLSRDWTASDTDFDVVLLHGDQAQLQAVQTKLAQRPGAIVSVVHCLPGSTAIPMERLLVERSLSINTSAAGGNATLMSLG
jgi:RHH-type proline utilization regulon transcriptional repressor/proline dehydrogenase/delta 1-pyrroline-5-carboxylate dehydrogenase